MDVMRRLKEALLMESQFSSTNLEEQVTLDRFMAATGGEAASRESLGI